MWLAIAYCRSFAMSIVACDVLYVAVIGCAANGTWPDVVRVRLAPVQVDELRLRIARRRRGRGRRDVGHAEVLEREADAVRGRERGAHVRDFVDVRAAAHVRQRRDDLLVRGRAAHRRDDARDMRVPRRVRVARRRPRGLARPAVVVAGRRQRLGAASRGESHVPDAPGERRVLVAELLDRRRR